MTAGEREPTFVWVSPRPILTVLFRLLSAILFSLFPFPGSFTWCAETARELIVTLLSYSLCCDAFSFQTNIFFADDFEVLWRLPHTEFVACTSMLQFEL